jgi:lipid-A-disaccharide synthase
LKNADKIFRDERPDAVILIDFPGFNWKIAKKAKAAGIPTIYFMPPQIWGWGQWRVKKMRRLIDLVFSCFGFEDAWFRENGVRSTLIGHPFFESTRNPQLDAAFLAGLGSAENGRSTATLPAEPSQTSDLNAKVGAATAPSTAETDATSAVAASPSQGAQYLTILPGSRNQEVTGNLADLLTTAQKVVAAAPDVRPVVAAFRAEHGDLVRAELERRGLDYPVYVGKTPELMRAATCCLAVSGSVSIEALSLCKPTVVLYRVGKLQNFALRFLKRVKYITLTNLLAISRVPGETPFYPKGEFAKQTEHTARERALMLFPEFISPNDRSDEAAAILADWFLDAASRNRRIAELETLRQATDFVDSPIELAVEKIAEELARRGADADVS